MAEVAYLPFLVALMIAVGLAADDPQSDLAAERCSIEQIYTFVNVTAFQENQNAVFASFRSNLSSYGFAASMEQKFGETDPVYGLAVCRKYLTAQECSECVSTAEAQVKDYCPRSNGGRVHMDGCFLKYDNFSFYAEDLDYGKSRLCTSTNDTDPQTFSQRATTLSRQLIENASVNNGYATGSIDAGSLYGVAQCWPTLRNISSCRRCLAAAQNQLLTCLPNRESRSLEAGCFMRYSTFSFFTHNRISQPLSGKSSSKVVPILLGSIGGTALVAVMCWILFYRRRIRHRRNNERTGDYTSSHTGNYSSNARKCVDARLDASMRFLLEWVWNKFQHDQVSDIVDLSLEGYYPREQVLRVIKIALLCTQGHWALRPAMTKVVSMLTNSSEITDQPTQPEFIYGGAGRTENFTSTANTRFASQGSVTVSLFPR